MAVVTLTSDSSTEHFLKGQIGIQSDAVALNNTKTRGIHQSSRYIKKFNTASSSITI